MHFQYRLRGIILPVFSANPVYFVLNFINLNKTYEISESISHSYTNGLKSSCISLGASF